MDGWEEAAFLSRHVHNRVNRNGGGSANRHRKSAFDVKRTFGSYELKCPAAEKLADARASTLPTDGKAEIAEENAKGKKNNKKKKRGRVKETASRLEIYCLSDEEDVLLGELILSDVLEAGVALAGSRKTLENAVCASRSSEALHDVDELTPLESGKPSQMRTSQEIENDRDSSALGEGGDERETAHGSSEAEQDSPNGQNPSDSSEQSESESDGQETKQRRRFATFEKNSFRQPKFWLAWSGHVLAASVPPSAESVTDASTTATTNGSGRGYVVFSGNECRKFKGTISCGALGWDDVAVEGWKRVTMGERDCPPGSLALQI